MRDRLRRYPALGFLGVAAALALLLPSTLTVPRAEPGSLREFAPVPGDAEGTSDLDAFDGASTAFGRTTPSRSSRGTATPKDAGAGGSAIRPKTKRCVGNPPRQTEDPLAPPCVAFFDGDNGGATARGVTADEVRVLMFEQGSTTDNCPQGSRPIGACGADTWYDLAAEPDPDERVEARMLRLLQRHFNERYQTYGRNVHFYVHYGRDESGSGSLQDHTPSGMRADAEEGLRRADPFAVLSHAETAGDAYASQTASKGVVTFPETGGLGFRDSFYRTYPGLLWSYVPSVEQRARLFTSFVCSQVAPYDVSFSGNVGDRGRERVYGLLRPASTTQAATGERLDTNRADQDSYTALIRSGLQTCGVEIVLERTFDVSGTICGDTRESTGNMAAMFQAGVTTIVWAGGFNTCHSLGGASIEYRPEMLIAGDGSAESTIHGQSQEQTSWRYARALTIETRRIPGREPCELAAYEADPGMQPADILYFCNLYPDVRQIFIGIQVAGPRLSPARIDQGFRSIPHTSSTTPVVPACFYEPGDYTCVKDAQTMWWDPTTQPPGSRLPGCWRMIEGGRRYVAAEWPRVELETRRRADDPCNAGFTIDRVAG